MDVLQVFIRVGLCGLDRVRMGSGLSGING